MTGKIAVLTASSNSGAGCVEALLSDPSSPSIRALFRTEEKAASLRQSHGGSPQLEIVTGIDAEEPDTLLPALQGCTIAFLVTPHSPGQGIAQDAAKVRNMMTAAAEAGVHHIIFGASWTSIVPDRVSKLAARFRPGEEQLVDLEKTSGITWTVLRGGFFFQNYLGFYKMSPGVEEDDVKMRFLDFCAPANDPEDIGRVAAVVAVAGGKGHEGKFYDISGPKQMWMEDVANDIGVVLKKTVRFVPMEKEECIAMLPDYLQEAFKYITDVGKGAIPFSDDVAKVTGNEALSFRQWATKYEHKFR